MKIDMNDFDSYYEAIDYIDELLDEEEITYEEYQSLAGDALKWDWEDRGEDWDWKEEDYEEYLEEDMDLSEKNYDDYDYD